LRNTSHCMRFHARFRASGRSLFWCDVNSVSGLSNTSHYMRLQLRFIASGRRLFWCDVNSVCGLSNTSHYMRLQLRFRASQESLFGYKFSASSAQYLALHKAPTSLGTDTQVHWAAPIAFLSDATGPWRNTQIFKIMDGCLVISCARLTNAKIFYRTGAGESVPVARQDHFSTLKLFVLNRSWNDRFASVFQYFKKHCVTSSSYRVRLPWRIIRTLH
jgi:hypothetical protein